MYLYIRGRFQPSGAGLFTSGSGDVVVGFGVVRSAGRKPDPALQRLFCWCINELLESFKDILHTTVLFRLPPLKLIQPVSSSSWLASSWQPGKGSHNGNIDFNRPFAP
jgi:hypothetical protein